MLAVFARVEPALRKSITFDNDTAFAQHALLRTMRAMTTWFCDVYASWQKGGVENASGRLRRWLPCQIDIDKLSDQEIQPARTRPCCGNMPRIWSRSTPACGSTTPTTSRPSPRRDEYL
jgi:IS30 family transposase